jgi:hypothetical protein
MTPVSLLPNNRRFVQAAWVVPDLEAAIMDWVRSMGVGPFFTIQRPQMENAVYRGKLGRSPLCAAALAQAGDLQIELVSQLDDEPSIFRDLVPAGKTGFHHMAIYSHKYDDDIAAYKQAGAEIAYIAPGNQICWMDTSPKLGFMVEIMSANPTFEAYIEKIKSAAENWDGKDPIRKLA